MDEYYYHPVLGEHYKLRGRKCWIVRTRGWVGIRLVEGLNRETIRSIRRFEKSTRIVFEKVHWEVIKLIN